MSSYITYTAFPEVNLRQYPFQRGSALLKGEVPDKATAIQQATESIEAGRPFMIVPERLEPNRDDEKEIKDLLGRHFNRLV